MMLPETTCIRASVIGLGRPPLSALRPPAVSSRASVIPLEHGRMVYVVEGGVAKRRSVELGFLLGRRVQVRSGLAAGDRLIVSGQRFVAPGKPVKVAGEPTTRPAATAPATEVAP